MALTPAQKTTLKTHIAANTNTVSVNGGSPVAINSLPMSDPDARAAVVGWYNLTATAADAQPFADSLNLWKPVVTIQELNAAVQWAQNPAGVRA